MSRYCYIIILDRSHHAVWSDSNVRINEVHYIYLLLRPHELETSLLQRPPIVSAKQTISMYFGPSDSLLRPPFVSAKQTISMYFGPSDSRPGFVRSEGGLISGLHCSIERN